MSENNLKVLIIYDDRELTCREVSNVVGVRRFGDIIFKRRKLFEHFHSALPPWAKKDFIRLLNEDDLNALKSNLESSGENTSILIIAGRAGFANNDQLTMFIERLPYAEEDFTDSLYFPLLTFFRNAHDLVNNWIKFIESPIHTWEYSWQNNQRLLSIKPLDLGKIIDFLSFTSGSTSTRHFNEVEIDTYYYTKRSNDKNKMSAEYSFYGLVPERMKPWLMPTFDFKDEGESASYKMHRYYLADVAFQWVHCAFDLDTFTPFIHRLLFFITDRPKRNITREQSLVLANELFVSKLERRVKEFLAMEEGQRINKLVSSTTPELDVTYLLVRYLKLFKYFEKGFACNYSVIGHGDPSFSNILYDQKHFLLKLIDPKGALSEQDLWTHPLYDMCKISHCILGNYDFINNGLFKITFSENNDLVLQLDEFNQSILKPIFLSSVKNLVSDIRILRLGEVSLFLSMLPLHIDFPNKVVAFLITAKKILDEIEDE